MRRAEAPHAVGGDRKRRVRPNPDPVRGQVSRGASPLPKDAWWAEGWTPLQPSPAREPLPWLPSEEALPVRMGVEGEGANALDRAETHGARRSSSEPSSNLPDLTIEERRARAAALRALLLARQRRFEPAEQAFREAAELDPALDLSLVTTFWDLERGGHEAAIRAYESLGRLQDAKWLRARVETRYRPRLVRSA